MDTQLDKISQTLGTETGLVYDEATPKDVEDITENMKSVIRKNNGDDYQFVRDNLRTAITSALSMLPGLVGLAKVAESPNLYNSAAGFIDSFSKLNQALLDNGMKMEKAVSSSDKVTKAVEGTKELPPPASAPDPQREAFAFEGTTEQLLDLALKAKGMQKAAEVVDVESAFVDRH